MKPRATRCGACCWRRLSGPWRNDVGRKRPMNRRRDYLGRRTREGCLVVVTKDHVSARPLKPRLDLWNHSPSGYEWGYGGSGPAQLALAILAEHCGDDEQAFNFHHRFKWAV